jgi:hypothetical protein
VRALDTISRVASRGLLALAHRATARFTVAFSQRKARNEALNHASPNEVPAEYHQLLEELIDEALFTHRLQKAIAQIPNLKALGWEAVAAQLRELMGKEQHDMLDANFGNTGGFALAKKNHMNDDGELTAKTGDRTPQTNPRRIGLARRFAR